MEFEIEHQQNIIPTVEIATARTRRRHSFQKERQNDHIPKRNAREICRRLKSNWLKAMTRP